MENERIISFKIYLRNEDSSVQEVRRLGIDLDFLSFSTLVKKCHEVFPSLSGKIFTVYWKDIDNDDVVISSDSELYTAINEINSDVKKLFLTIKDMNSHSKTEVHPRIICDGCNEKISGFRYKCIVCFDFDLCRECEKSIHCEHPMLRITSPDMFEQDALKKLIYCLSGDTLKKLKKHGHSHRERKTHAHDTNATNFCKKKKRFDKCYSETDDFDKHFDDKSLKYCGYLYKHLMDGVFNFLEPIVLQDDHLKKDPTNSNKEHADEPHHVKYLKSIQKTLTSFLDPLGVDVDVEIRTKHDSKNDTEKEENHDDKQEASTSKDTDSQSKGVHFADSGKVKGTLNEKVDEITNILANQTVNESPEREDWVSFEELKRYESGTPPEEAQSASNCPHVNEQSPTTSAQRSQNVYPNLNLQRSTSGNPIIDESLEKMLSMGFTNEDGWLRQLLEIKKGDISQVVEALTPHKKS